ncbi:hypothetical protein HIM_00759 [Hirsutella minnesotensis 3608]|nr:hypothetical protein HIM_00759 [Hirsutella minnesotensis 3608]
MDREIPVTKLPLLDSFNHSTTKPRSSSCNESQYQTASRALNSRHSDSPNAIEQGLALSHYQLLHSFAAFLLAFTGDGDVSFDYLISSIPSSGAPLQSGIAHATAPESADAKSPSEAQLVLLQDIATCGSDFGFVIQQDDELQTLPSAMSDKLFLVTVSKDNCSLRFPASRISHRLLEPILSSLLSYLSPSTNANVCQGNGSVLNHPPLAAPPDFESKLGLRPSSAERRVHELHSAFTARVRDHPDRPAIDYIGKNGRVTYSYKELDHLSSALASHLRRSLAARGCEQNGHIIVLLHQSPELYVAWLGVLKAGYTFCPVPVESRSELLVDLAEELESRLVLSSGAGPSSLGAVLETSHDLEYLDLEAFLQRYPHSHQPSSQKHTLIRPDDVAYIMYTSGSTGKPKGVQVTHLGAACAIASNIVAAPEALQQGTGGTRWFQFAAPTFDASVTEVFITLSVGGTICACNRAMAMTDPEAAMTELEADSIMTTPSVAALLRPDKVPRLRYIWSIGEALNTRVIETFAAPGDPPSWKADHNLINTYGPTEATVNCTLDQVSQEQRGSVIGGAIPTCSIILLDPTGNSDKPVPLGFSGELAIGGPQVSAGYLKRPDQNAKSFVEVAPFGRLYRTGDRARLVEGLNGDLSIDFLGRISSGQIKITGRRVELGEIEAAITGPAVAEAAVIYIPATSPTEPSQLIAVVVPRMDYSLDQVFSDCQARAEELLQPFMRPSKVYMLAKLPRTASDKVDRKVLQKMCLSPSDSGLVMLGAGEKSSRLSNLCEEHSPSHRGSEMFSRVIDVIVETVSADESRITPSSTLPSLGLDSLHAIQLLQRARDQGLPNLKFTDVLSCRTVGDLTERYEAQERIDKESLTRWEEAPKLQTEPLVRESDGNHSKLAAGGSPPSQDIHQETTNRTAQTSKQLEWEKSAARFDQQWRMLIAQTLGDDSGVFKLTPTTAMQDGVLVESLREPLSYWGSFSWKLSPSTDVKRLREAWETILAKTQILRSGFVAPDFSDTPVSDISSPTPTFIQVIYDEAQLPWAELNCEDDGLQAHLKMLHNDVATRHYADRFASPPWQITIATTEKQRLMVLTLHHSLYDGEMLRYLVADVVSAYSDLRHEIERCQVQEALNRLAASQETATSLEYWTEQLKSLRQDCDDELEPSQAQQKAQIVHRTIEMKANLSKAELAQAAADLGVPSFNSLIRVAYGSMLAELSEAEHYLLAEIRSERVLEARLADAMAPLVSAYPVPFTLSGTPRQMVAAQAELAIKSLEHGSIHAGLVRKIVRKRADETLYPAVFVFHPFVSETSATSLWDDMQEVFDLSVDHSFALNVLEAHDGTITLSLSVDETLMNSASQDVFLREIDALLTNMTLHPDAPSTLHLTQYFPSSLVSYNQPPCPDDYIRFQEPTEYVELLAGKHPDWKAVEVVTGFDTDTIRTSSWTYEQLNKVANQVAHYIRSLSYHGKTIAMCLERDLMSFAVILGIMKSRNAYVPIEMSLPKDRQSFILRDSGAVMLFTTGAGFHPDDPQDALHVITVNPSFVGLLQDMSDENPIHPKYPDLDAYFLYTSGSTGVPKGVRVGRANLCSFTDGLSYIICTEAPATRNLGGRGKYICLASRAFDVHLCEMFLAWRNGMCATIGDRFTLLDNLARALKELRITHASFVPSLLDQTGLVPSDVPDLIYIGVGGEKMTPQTHQIWSSSDHVSLINAYGPTEATIGCCATRLHPCSDTRNVGPPYIDSQAHVLILGTELHAKRGMPGELAITGNLVANGYHNRPDATGFCTFEGRRMYRTGDVVRMEPDGSILFLGRKDDQVKVRGQRLELGEVSQAVRAASPETLDVATLLLKHPEMSRQTLVSFVASPGSGDRTEPVFLSERFAELNDELKKACEATLPAYMVPDFLVPVSFLPLTPTAGKTDNKLLTKLFRSIALRSLYGEHGSTSNGIAAPKRELNLQERRIVDAIAKVIPQQSRTIVGPETSVFQLGVDSITAVTISSRLRKLGFNASVAQILRNQSVEQLALSIATSRSTFEEKDLADRAAEDYLKTLDLQVRQELVAQASPLVQRVQSVWPCLPLQEILVAHSLGHGVGEDAQYINHAVFELAAGVDLNQIKSAWENVIRRTDILRTCFHFRDKDIVQLVLQPEECQIKWRAVSGEAQHLRQILEKSHRTLSDDIIKNMHCIPPLRLTMAYAEESNSTSYLMLSIHHGLYDLNSLSLILQDVETAFFHGHLSEGGSIKPLMRHIVGQQQRESQACHFWQTMLQDQARTRAELPTTANPSQAERVFGARLGELERQCVKSNLSLAGLMQGLFAYVLAQALNEDNVTFGVVLSGRSIDIEGIDEIRAPCITTIPQRFRWGKGPKPLAELVSSMQKQLFQAMEYQHTSLRSISSWLGISGALFSSIFSFVRSTTSTAQTSGGERLMKHVAGHMSLDHALTIECEANPYDDSLTLRAETRLEACCDALDSMLEKMEVLANALLDGQQVVVSPVNKPSISAGPSTHESNAIHQPWSALERTIRDAIVNFSDVNHGDIEKNTPLIRFGIDSITTIRFAKLLRQQGIQVSGADVVRNPCVKDLARFLETSQSKVGIPLQQRAADGSRWSVEMLRGVLSSSELDGIEAVYPLSPLQAGMATATLSLNSRMYSHQHTLSLAMETDTARLKQSWQELLQRHDILRTSFIAPNGKSTTWIGAVHRDPIIVWDDVVADDLGECLSNLAHAAKFEDATSFRTPPVRATMVRNSSELVFVASLHHATYDMISIDFIFQDLWTLYNQQCPPLRRPFYDAAPSIWSMASQSTDFWTKHVTGYESFRIPLTTEEEKSSVLSTASQPLLRGVTSVDAWCARMRVSAQSLVFLALSKAVCSLVGVRDVVLGQVLSARVSIEEADMIAGPMLNTLPFRLRISDAAESNIGCLQRVQDFHDQALDHQHGSLVDIQKNWRGQDSMDELFDCLFVFRKETEQTWNKHTPWSLRETPDTGDAQLPSHYRLNVEVEQKSDGSFVAMASSKMSEENLKNLLDLFAQCLQDIMVSPDRLAIAFPPALAEATDARSSKLQARKTETFDREALDRFFHSLCAVLSEVTGSRAADIAPYTSIYALGIDSIVAIRVASASRNAGIPLTTADIIRNTKVGKLCEVAFAKSIETRQERSPSPESRTELVGEDEIHKALAILGQSREAVEDVLPALPGQEHFLRRWLQSGKIMYEPTWAFQSRRKLDPVRLQQAWRQLKARFATLRTCFVAVNGARALQVVSSLEAADDMSADLAVHAADADSDLETVVRKKVTQAYQEPSSLFRPSARISLVQGSADEGDAVILTLHHATYDGWSMGLLVSELSALYEYPGGVMKPLPSFSRFVRETIQSAKKQEAETFWANALSCCQPTLVGNSVDNNGLASPENSNDANSDFRPFVTLECPGISVVALEAAARRCGITPQAILVAAFARTLGRATGVHDPVFGYWTAGRSSSFDNIESVPGPTVNMLPLAIPEDSIPAMSSPQTVAAERLQRLQETLSARATHEQTSLRDVLQWAGVSGCSDLFNVELNILWGDEILLSSPAMRDSLLAPWTLGLPSDFMAKEPNRSLSAVDALDVGVLPARELYVDVGPSPETPGSLQIGVGCDPGLQTAADLKQLLRSFRDEATQLLGCLSA